ncbi:MAG: rRNA adenine N-6-methyltransferase family protein, partial [Patescibacteria group bacterium]
RFLRLFLSNPKLRPSLMALMIQKEVAERIIARDGKESLLSLSVKSYGEPKIIKTVRKGNFFPQPKVDSAIIKINPFVRSSVSDIGAEQVLELARKAFQQKRKMLRHSLGKWVPEKYRNKRPEELKLKDWETICWSQSGK